MNNELINEAVAILHDAGRGVLADEVRAVHAAAALLAVQSAEFRRESYAERARADALDAELKALREQLKSARETLQGFTMATPKHWELPRMEFLEEFYPWARSRAEHALQSIAAPVPASQDDARDAAELAEALRRCLSSINETWTVYERAVLAKYDRRVLAAKEK